MSDEQNQQGQQGYGAPPPGGGYGSPYGQQGQYGGGAYAPRQTNGMAIASLIAGILGLTLCTGLASPLALIFGYIGKNQIDESGGSQEGRGLAVAGIITGWIGVALVILVIVAIIALGGLAAIGAAFSGSEGGSFY